jgi:PAS domain S-box-containing protein
VSTRERAHRRESVTTVLLVEDQPGDARLLREMLDEPGYHGIQMTHVTCMREAEAHVAEHRASVILLDLGLPDAQGLEAVRRAHAAAPACPLVVLTAVDDELVAVQALQEGAQDYLIKGQIDTRGLLRALRYAVERKQASEKLRESERRFSAMLGNVELSSVMLDREARITYINPCLLDMCGWQRAEVIGRNWFDVFMPPEFGDMRPVFAQLLEDSPEAWHRDHEVVTRSGGRRMIRWNNSVLRSVLGQIVGTASIGEDITDRLVAEEVLARRAAELERFHRLSVGRELQMIELKKQINALASQLGHAPPYDLSFLAAAGGA